MSGVFASGPLPFAIPLMLMLTLIVQAVVIFPPLCKGRKGGVDNDLPPLTPPYRDCVAIKGRK